MIIAISLLFEIIGVGDVPVQLKVNAPSGEVPMTMIMMFHAEQMTLPGQIYTASLAGIPLPISAEGNIVIEARQYEEEWQTIRILPVIANPTAPGLSSGIPSASAIALEPPSAP